MGRMAFYVGGGLFILALGWFINDSWLVRGIIWGIGWGVGIVLLRRTSGSGGMGMPSSAPIPRSAPASPKKSRGRLPIPSGGTTNPPPPPRQAEPPSPAAPATNTPIGGLQGTVLDEEKAKEETPKADEPYDAGYAEAEPSLDDGLDFDEVLDMTPPPVEMPAPQAKPIPAPSAPAPSPAPVIPTTTEAGKLPDGYASIADAMRVYFAAYYPKEMRPNDWQPLHAYFYRHYVEAQVLADIQTKLGEKMAEFRQASGTASQALPEGVVITATPYLEGFQFNPPFITVGFFKEWHRLDFELRAQSAPLNVATNGRLTFSVDGVIVGDVPLSIYVGESVTQTQPVHATQKIYEAIFASYSHKDTTIVERVERVCKSLGLDYLRDVTTLKSGQHWSDELLALINRADIFQLFWSSYAAESDYVRREWEFALKAKGDNHSFIRPVYWQDPMPDVPSELSHLHFAFQPHLAED